MQVGVHQRRQDHGVDGLGGAVAPLDRRAGPEVHEQVAVERHRPFPQGRCVRSGKHPGRGDDAEAHREG